LGQGDLGEQIEASGVVSVAGADRDFVITIEEAAATRTLSVHSSARSDLLLLDGVVVRATLPESLLTGRSVLLSDRDGPLYILDSGGSAISVNALFGREVVSLGELVAEDEDDVYANRYHRIRIAADAGTVELLPGDAAHLEIDGARWRVAAIAAVESEPAGNEVPLCMAPGRVLSYEMLRVAEAGADERIVRPAAAVPVLPGCR
jgi:hypothetical protein